MPAILRSLAIILTVNYDTISETMSEHFCEAQTFAGRKYAMATIKTQQGAFLI